jgi:hypothetical protein
MAFTAISTGIAYDKYMRGKLLRESADVYLASAPSYRMLDEVAWVGACAGAAVGGVMGRMAPDSYLPSGLRRLYASCIAGSLTGVAMGVVWYGAKNFIVQ